MEIAFIGHGAFGQAIGSLIKANGHTYQVAEIDSNLISHVDTVFLAVPVQMFREALRTNREYFTQNPTIINLCKGIEVESGLLPFQIVQAEIGNCQYVTVSGPSFASEIVSGVPTVVSIASEVSAAAGLVQQLMTCPNFKLEALGTVLELELAGAMKNIYAIAAGYVSGDAGGRNTLAHLQVVALREYVSLVSALEGSDFVIRPGIVGDLFLTTGSRESRNFQYGEALGKDIAVPAVTAEGVGSAKAIQKLAQTVKVDLPLAAATQQVITQAGDARSLFYKALGFTL